MERARGRTRLFRSTNAATLSALVICISTSPATALLAPSALRGGGATLARIAGLQTRGVDDAAPATRIDAAARGPQPEDPPATGYVETQLIAEVSRLVKRPPPEAIRARLEGVLPRSVSARLWSLLGGA